MVVLHAAGLYGCRGVRGLGRVVMCALDAASRTLGARRGLLGATADGYAMYCTLGWHVQSPLASGVIVGELRCV